MSRSKTRDIPFPAVVRHLWALLPSGGSLPEDVWRKRHQFLLGLTWFHAVVIALVGPVVGYTWELSLRAPFHDGTVLHTIAEGSIVALFALLASWRGFNRVLRASLVGFGLISSSAILVHLSGGYIELHFHFFVMLVFLALYQDWVPYGLAVLYVAIHHGVVGVLWPREVYNHPAAINAPWTWAGIHAFFVLWSCVGSIIAWRLNEAMIAQTKVILDSAGEGIYGVGLDGKATFVNPAAAKMLGYDVKELVGRSMHDVLHHSRADGTRYPSEECPIYAAFKDGTVHRVTEEMFWRKDGTGFPSDYVSTPIFESGELTGAVVAFRDVTQRKQREQALQESEQRFRQIAENIKQVFWVSDPIKNAWLYISPAYKEVWGKNPDDMGSLAQSWLGAIHHEDLGRVLAAVVTKQVMGDYDEEYRIVRPDSSIRWIRDRAFPVRNNLGKVYRITGIAEDVTERKTAQEALLRSDARKRAILESALDAVISIDHEGRIIEFNPAAERTFGYPRSEVIGKAMADLIIPPSLREAHHRGVAHYLATGQGPVLGKRIELTAIRADGTEFPAELTITPIDTGSLPIFTGFIRDIAERKRAEEKLQARYKELETLHEMGQTILSSPNLKAILEKILDQALSIASLDIGNIRLFNLDGGRTQGAFQGYRDPENIHRHHTDSMGSPSGILVAKVLASKKTVVVEDVSACDGLRTFKREGVQSVVVIPISTGEEVLGVIELGSHTPRNFQQDEVRLLEAVGNQIGIAAQKARLLEEAERRAKEQEALNVIAKATSQSLHRDELLEIALDKVIEVTGRERASIRLKDPVTDKVSLASHRGLSQKEIEGLVQTVSRQATDQVFASGQPLVVNDQPGHDSQSLLPRSRSVAWIPMKAGAEVAGVLCVSTTRPVFFVQREVDLLQAIANVIGVAIENARLFAETQRNLERIGALREIDQAINSTLDLRATLDVLLAKIDLVLPYSAATVRLFNKESGLLDPVACRNLEEEEWKVPQWKGGRGLANVVFETKAPLIMRNAQADPRVRDPEFYRKHKLTSYVGVPLIVKEEVLGVLNFYTKEEHEFSSEEVEFLSTLAGQAAIAIYNARLYEETERRRREAEELARVAQSLTGTLDMSAVGEQIVTSVRELFGVRVATLRLLQPDGSLRALASSGEAFSQNPGGDAVSSGIGLTSRAIAEGKPICSADMLNDPEIRLSDQMRDYQLRSGNRSIIAVPLQAHEMIIGALALLDETGRIYSESEVALVQTFADQAALALENARLYEEARTREAQLQETNRMLSALHEVAAAASESLDLDRVFQTAIEKITEMFRFDATRIHLYDERTDELVLRASSSNDPDRFTAARSFPIGQGIIGKVAESGKALIFEDTETDPLYQKTSRTKVSGQFGYHFFAVFPIRGKLKNLGTLGCVGTAPRKLNSGEIQLLEAITDRIAVAIENGELYEQLKQKVRELEQKTAELERANKVKDEFLSVMSHELRTPLNVVVGYAGMIKDGMLGDTNPEQKSALEKVMSRTNDLLTMITSILYATSIEANEVHVEPHRFALGDLFDELRVVCDIPQGKPLTLIWDYPSDLPAVESDKEKLRHILQNLIYNAIKFTEQGHVTVSARIKGKNGQWTMGSDPQSAISQQQPGNGARDEFVEFKVADTGIGIPVEKLPIIFEMFRQGDSSETRLHGGVGLGLYIAKNFAELLGGKIEVESEQGKGSTFTVGIPCAIDPSAMSSEAMRREEALEHGRQLH